MTRLLLPWFLLIIPFAAHASMHWLVTENGMVESLSDTHMNMKRPWDLVEWLRQEERVDLVNAIDNRLRESDRLLAKSASKDPDFEAKFMVKNTNCRAAGKPLGSFDLYLPTVLSLENKGIDSLMYITIVDFDKMGNEKLSAPVCERFTKLDFSSYAFEHLPGIQGRNTLSISPEVFLYRVVIPSAFTPDQFGHMIYLSLEQNSTSWVLHNLAAFYWRVKGVAPRAIECLRRALHFSPRRYADIALVSMANVLHLGRRSQDAAVLMHAALQISPNYENHHYMLGNVFAVLGDYNASQMHYQTAMNLRNAFSSHTGHDEELPSQQADDTELRLYAVRCLQELTTALEKEHSELEHTWEQLRKYEQSGSYEHARNRIRKEEADHEMKMDARLHYEQQVLIEQSNHVGQTCKMIQNKDGRKFLKCSWGSSNKKNQNQRSDEGSKFLARHLANKEDPNKIEMARYKAKVDSLHTMQYLQSIDYNKPLRPPLYYQLNELSDKSKLSDPSWPESKDCFSIELPTPDKYPTTYLPPENKGFEVRAILTEAQGLNRVDEHDLPWYPPQCMQISLLDPNEKSYDYLDAMKARYNIARPVHLLDKFFDAPMTHHLKSLVTNKNARIEDIGQRIFTAMKQKLGPDWLLYSLAGLYWRVQGHLFFGIECMRRALYSVPAAYKDVPLVNLANMFYKWGRIDDAFIVIQDALAVNGLEPETHFFLANLLAAKKNFTGALHHYIVAIRQNPEHKQAWELAKASRCEIKRLNKLKSNSVGHRSGKSETDSAHSSRDGDGGSKASSDSSGSRDGGRQMTKEMREQRQALITLVIGLFRKHKMCSDAAGNSDCEHIIERMIGDRTGPDTFELPHIKLVPVNEVESKRGTGQGAENSEADKETAMKTRVIRGFLWNVDHHSISVEDDECIIFNDTSRTIGCHVTEGLFPISETVIQFFYECLKVIRPKDFGQSRHSVLDQEVSKASTSLLNDDGTEFIKEQIFLSWPTWHDCVRHKTIDFNAFASTLLTVQAKNVEISTVLGQYSPVRTMYPICKAPVINVTTELGLNLSKIAEGSTDYSAEIGLKETFEFLLPEETDFDKTASRVAMGLVANASSWVMANLAGLYWRIRGDTQNAMSCLVNAYYHAPNASKDVALIGIANILHKIGMIEEALEVTKKALKHEPRTTVAHFTMANLYAVRKDWHRATLFYESTLGLQGTFKPAVERLRAIQCRQVLSKPVRSPMSSISGERRSQYNSVVP